MQTLLEALAGLIFAAVLYVMALLILSL